VNPEEERFRVKNATESPAASFGIIVLEEKKGKKKKTPWNTHGGRKRKNLSYSYEKRPKRNADSYYPTQGSHYDPTQLLQSARRATPLMGKGYQTKSSSLRNKKKGEKSVRNLPLRRQHEIETGREGFVSSLGTSRLEGTPFSVSWACRT